MNKSRKHKSRKYKRRKQESGCRGWWIRKKRGIIVLALAVVLAAAILGVSACVAGYGFPEPLQALIDIQPDQNAKNGTLHATEAQEVAAGDFWVVMNQLPVVEEGSRECSIEYENPSTNHYSARISLYGKEDGELLGNTRRVDPGNYVETIVLKKELPPGEYPVTVRVELFEEKKPAAELSIEITLRVSRIQDGTGRE